MLSGLDTGPTGSGGGGSSGMSGSSSSAGASGSGGNSSVAWRKANLTNFESYPDPGSDECLNFNGCTWAGMFAGIEGKQTLDWVKAHDILAVHSKDFAKYELKTCASSKVRSRLTPSFTTSARTRTAAAAAPRTPAPSAF